MRHIVDTESNERAIKALCEAVKYRGRCPGCKHPLPVAIGDDPCEPEEVVLECYECGWSDTDIVAMLDKRQLPIKWVE